MTVAIAFVAALAFAAPARAATMPNPADFTNGDDIRLSVSRAGLGNGLQAPVSLVTVYFPESATNTYSLYIENYNHCTNPPDTNVNAPTTYSFFNSNPDGSRATSRAQSDLVSNVKSSVCRTQRVDFAKNALQQVTIGAQVYYPVHVRAQHTGVQGGLNSFRYAIAGGFIGYSSEAGENFTLQARLNQSSTPRRYDVNFGTDCSISNPVVRTLDWFDDDVGSGAQPSPITMSLIERAPDGSITNTQQLNPTFTGNNASGSISVTLNPNRKYTWRWDGINDTNGLQFAVPFDGIFNDVDCDATATTGGVTTGGPGGNPGGNDPTVFSCSAAEQANETRLFKKEIDSSFELNKYKYGLAVTLPGQGEEVLIDTDKPIAPGFYRLRAIVADNHITHRPPFRQPPVAPEDPSNPDNDSQTYEQFYIQLDSGDPLTLSPRPSPDVNASLEYIPANRNGGDLSSDNLPNFSDGYDFIGSGFDKQTGLPLGSVFDQGTAPLWTDDWRNGGGGQQAVSIARYRIGSIADWNNGVFPADLQRDSGFDMGVVELTNSSTQISLRHIVGVHDWMEERVFNGGIIGLGGYEDWGNSITPISIIVDCASGPDPMGGGFNIDVDASVTPSVGYPGESGVALYEACTKPGNAQALDIDLTINGQGPIPDRNENTDLPGNGQCAFYNSSFTIPLGAAPGTRWCTTISASPATDAGGSVTSTPACVTVQENPYLRVYGSGVISGGAFQDNLGICSDLTAGGNVLSIARDVRGNLRGSAAEYAVRATKDVIDFGSQDAARSTVLTFANTFAGGVAGNFATDGDCIPNYFNQASNRAVDSQEVFNLSTAGPSQLIGNINSWPNGTNPSGQGQYNVDAMGGTVTIHNGSNLRDLDTNTILVIDGDLDINSNITYKGTYANRDDVPSLVVIVRGDIRISQSVTRIDGLFIAVPQNDGSEGTIDTCYQANGSRGNCQSQLVINGAFIARYVDFRRHFGSIGQAEASNNDRANAAELFLFSPELYLANTGLVTEDATARGEIEQFRDLPPIIN